MNKEDKINKYMLKHGRRDNVVFTWILWNYDKLNKIWNNEKIYADHNLYEELEQEAYKDQFVVLITDNGKYRACEPKIVK